MLILAAALSCLMTWPPASDSAIEWGFREAQEQFAVEAAPARALASLPSDVRALLASMASDDWRHREWASRTMFGLGDAALIACYAGQRIPDPEVGLRCRNVLRRLSWCRGCEGRGYYQASWGEEACQLCDGRGHLLPTSDFLND